MGAVCHLVSEMIVYGESATSDFPKISDLLPKEPSTYGNDCFPAIANNRAAQTVGAATRNGPQACFFSFGGDTFLAVVLRRDSAAVDVSLALEDLLPGKKGFREIVTTMPSRMPLTDTSPSPTHPMITRSAPVWEARGRAGSLAHGGDLPTDSVTDNNHHQSGPINSV